MDMVFCRGCGKELHVSAATCPGCGAPQGSTVSKPVDIPDGVKGWSWGAFLLNWIWAIGNKTWIGLLALIPYVGFGVAIWLGIKGREMAWKNGQWEGVEHFNRVQRKWSQWAVGLIGGAILIGITAAIALPAYQSYTRRAQEQAEAASKVSDTSAAPAGNQQTAGSETSSAMDSDEIWQQQLVATAAEVNKGAPSNVDALTRLDSALAGPGRKFTYVYTLVSSAASDIGTEQLEHLTKTLKTQTCQNSEMKVFFKNKTTLVFRYNDKDGQSITDIEVLPSDCGYRT